MLQIFPPFGTGRFCTGPVGMAGCRLLLLFPTRGVGALWPIADGIVVLLAGGTEF